MVDLHGKFTWNNLHGIIHMVCYMVDLHGVSASDSDSKIFSMVSNTSSSWTNSNTCELGRVRVKEVGVVCRSCMNRH